jgi:hypothetical protein
MRIDRARNQKKYNKTKEIKSHNKIIPTKKEAKNRKRNIKKSLKTTETVIEAKVEVPHNKKKKEKADIKTNNKRLKSTKII